MIGKFSRISTRGCKPQANSISPMNRTKKIILSRLSRSYALHLSRSYGFISFYLVPMLCIGMHSLRLCLKTTWRQSLPNIITMQSMVTRTISFISFLWVYLVLSRSYALHRNAFIEALPQDNLEAEPP